jgi:hypothetical protein
MSVSFCLVALRNCGKYFTAFYSRQIPRRIDMERRQEGNAAGFVTPQECFAVEGACGAVIF